MADEKIVEAGARETVLAADVKKSKSVAVQLPKKIMLQKAFALNLQMPGQSSSVTIYHREGKEITCPEVIGHLTKAGAPMYILEQ